MGLFKRKNSPYYFMKFQLNGRRIYESTKTANKKLAEDIYLDRRREILSGIEPARENKIDLNYTFNGLAERYLEFTTRLKSHSRLKSFVNTLKKTFGDKRLNSFNLADIEALQGDTLKRGLTISYTNHLSIILKTMFNKALDWELVSEDVVKKLKKCKQLKGENKRLKYLSEEEAERLIDNCDSHLKPVVITALNTGMRKSEILNLMWDRVDLRNRIMLLDMTKNGERREIPINNTLLNALSGLTRHLKTDYVFYNPDTLKPYYDLKKPFLRALAKSHIMDFHFHDLRHTFASRLVMKGIDLTTVKELLGHKDIKMTLRYAHLAPAHIRKAVEILDECCKIVAVGYKGETGKL